MKNLIFSFLLLVFVSCGGLKKEINRLTVESKSKTEFYEKKISELQIKISETENRETKTQTELSIKNLELSSLKKELTQVKQELEKKESSNFGVENAVGPVKITDTKSGMSYEFNSAQGTKINNSSESVSKEKYNTVTQSLSKETARSENLSRTIASQETSIKEKNTQITEQKEEITELLAKVKTLNEQLAKSILKKGIPWYVWTLFGMFLLALIQLLWKVYKPKKIIL